MFSKNITVTYIILYIKFLIYLVFLDRFNQQYFIDTIITNINYNIIYIIQSGFCFYIDECETYNQI